MANNQEDNILGKSACEQPKKKRGLIKRIFRWLGLILLAILLVLSLVFQAPWKIITLLAIIFLACTILPKQFRKWFCLSATAVIVVLIIWVFLPNEDGAWRPYTFDEELAALQAKYVIPGEENAAKIYGELLDAVPDRDPNEPEFFLRSSPSSRNGPWRTADHPETAEWLKGYQGTIEKLLQAAKKDKCQFTIGSDPVSYLQYTEQLPNMHRGALLLVSSANNDIAEGRTDAALEKYLCIIQIANHMYQQPAMMYHLVGYAIEYLALIPINRFVIECGSNGEQLELICNSIKGVGNNWSSNWRRMLDFEKLYAKNSLCSLIYEVNPKGEIRFSGGQLILDRQFPKKKSAKTYWQKRLTRAKVIFGWLYFPSTPQKVSEFIDTNFEKYYAMAEPDFDWSKELSQSKPPLRINYRSLVDMLTNLPGPAYYRVHEIYIRNLSFRRGSRLLLAIKQYQINNERWPENLNAIKSLAPAEAFIDPVNGKEFKYENHDERFSLYGEAINIWPK